MIEFLHFGPPALPSPVGQTATMADEVLYDVRDGVATLTLNRPDSFKFGTVGEPFAETEIAIDQASGEVLARGPQVMWMPWRSLLRSCANYAAESELAEIAGTEVAIPAARSTSGSMASATAW
mgnify:CR=1 FL=1